MQVICIDQRNILNKEFSGPSPKEGDILTVSFDGMIDGIPSYQFVEFGPRYAYSKWRFAPLPGIDETEEVIEKEEAYA